MHLFFIPTLLKMTYVANNYEFIFVIPLGTDIIFNEIYKVLIHTLSFKLSCIIVMSCKLKIENGTDKNKITYI